MCIRDRYHPAQIMQTENILWNKLYLFIYLFVVLICIKVRMEKYLQCILLGYIIYLHVWLYRFTFQFGQLLNIGLWKFYKSYPDHKYLGRISIRLSNKCLIQESFLLHCVYAMPYLSTNYDENISAVMYLNNCVACSESCLSIHVSSS